jgi:outer membrane immunogenic protein
MRRFLLASAAFCVLIAPAIAADQRMPLKAPPPAPAPVRDWSGCYVGIEGGGAWGRSHHTTADSLNLDIAAPFDLSGALIGGTYGCNLQQGQWVFGLEGDGSWTNKKGSGRDVSPFNTSFQQETKEETLITLRSRIGWAPAPQWLVYVTGGVAVAQISVKEFNTLFPNLSASDSNPIPGWTVGGGVEWMLWQNISAKLEYLYVDFGKNSFFNPPITPGNCGCLRANVTVTDHIARAGLNWHFN